MTPQNRLESWTMRATPQSVCLVSALPREGGQTAVAQKMKLNTLKEFSTVNVLLEGKSGRGKTYNACQIAVEVLDSGGSVLYIDTETQGSKTLVKVVEEGYHNDVVEDLDYRRASDLDSLMPAIDEAEDYDMVVVDTLDHKHGFVIEAVTEAKSNPEADWNEYPVIYSKEKEVMQALENSKTSVVATLDPESGSSEKPKGAQTNVRGYFDVVFRLVRNDAEWGNSCLNWVGQGDRIGKTAGDLPGRIVEELADYGVLED